MRENKTTINCKKNLSKAQILSFHLSTETSLSVVSQSFQQINLINWNAHLKLNLIQCLRNNLSKKSANKNSKICQKELIFSSWQPNKALTIALVKIKELLHLWNTRYSARKQHLLVCLRTKINLKKKFSISQCRHWQLKFKKGHTL